MTLPEQARIIYRGFYDVPRMIIAFVGDERLLLDCRFDPVMDEYPDTYELYRMSPDFVAPDGSWEPLVDQAVERLGSIPVEAVEFDPTRRQWIKTDVLRRFLPAG